MEFLLLMCVSLCVSYLTWSSSTDAMAVDHSFMPKQILVFGGNGMLGSAAVERLIPLEHKLVLVNRGNYYWDTPAAIDPYIQQLIRCDRRAKLSDCQGLTDYLNSVSSIDVVIDFSGYHPQAIENVLDVLNRKAQLYIYVSTDSVYEVCGKSHSQFSIETDAVRPSDEKEQNRLNSKDPYGHFKLQCEEVLRDYHQKGKGPPFIILRLPDVIGPRDNTGRWWTYQLWMKLQPFLEKKIAVPQYLASKPLGFVYVNDVADVIFYLVENPNEDAFNEAFNLAFAETPNLTTVLNDIKTELELSELSIEVSDEPNTITLFPSVHLGPLNISKAENILNWKPTDWQTALKHTVLFYENAIGQPEFHSQRVEMIRKLQGHFTSQPNNVIIGLGKMYGLTFGNQRDEL